MNVILAVVQMVLFSKKIQQLMFVVIENNTYNGIKINGGDLIIKNNEINLNNIYGVFINNMLVPQIEDNNFKENGISDIYRK